MIYEVEKKIGSHWIPAYVATQNEAREILRDEYYDPEQVRVITVSNGVRTIQQSR